MKKNVLAILLSLFIPFSLISTSLYRNSQKIAMPYFDFSKIYAPAFTEIPSLNPAMQEILAMQ